MCNSDLVVKKGSSEALALDFLPRGYGSLTSYLASPSISFLSKNGENYHFTVFVKSFYKKSMWNVLGI